MVGDVGIQGVKSRLALQRFSNELFSVAGSFGEFDQAAEEKRNYTNWLCETIEKPKQLYEEAGRILEQQFSRYLESQMMWNDRHVRAALRYISAISLKISNWMILRRRSVESGISVGAAEKQNGDDLFRAPAQG